MRLLFFCLFISSFAFSQKSDDKIAYQYYITGDFEKAVTIYEELMNINFSPVYYTPYYTSLIKSANYIQAESLAKRMVRKYPKNVKYQIEVIIAQEKSGKKKIADKAYQNILKNFDAGRSNTYNIANTFARHEIYQKAIDLYTLSEKIDPKNSFAMQKAQLFSKIENVEMMLNEYLNEVERSPARKQIIISRIQKFLDNNGIKSDKNYKLVKKLLLTKVRLEQNRTDFTEILIWLFIQNNKFEMAFLQAKALDRRTGQDGGLVYELADSFLEKRYFRLAEQAYDYIISKGFKSKYFIEANINRLQALTKSISNKNFDLSILDNEYKNVINTLGKNKNTVILFANYAHFKAFYLHDLQSADSLLQVAMSINGIDNYKLAECKLAYSDILLLNGDIWESLLYCSQVEKDFKEHQIGHDAKLRVAKISYYQGDFQWAQAQLGILKASTSKLIANNAMQLSLLITDNYNLDTSEIPMRTFASAELLYYQQRYVDAIKKYDSILIEYPMHTLSDEIYMRKGDIYFENGEIEDALANYTKIEEDWNYDILSDDALYKRAKISDDFLKDNELAMKLYQQILLDHSSSIYAAESRLRFRYLRGDNLNDRK